MEAKLPVVAPEQGVLANSKAELLDWMKGGPKTLGWDALVAFDRATINNTFRQQYITRFSSANTYAPITFVKPTTGTLHRYVHNCILSEPTVSFIGAKLSSSDSPARLSLELLDGSEVTLDYSPEPSALKINALSALGSPVLDMKIKLAMAEEEGHVGAISVDLARGENYTLSSGDSSWEISEFGRMFHEEFEKWTESQRRWVINRIKENEGPLAIKRVHLRSQPAPGSNVRAADNYGDGAVIALIQMEGGQEGTFPNDESWKYLVPNDGPSYTCSIILGKRRLLGAVATSVFREAEGWVTEQPKFEIRIGQDTGEEYVRFTSGRVWRPSSKTKLPTGVWVSTAEPGSWPIYSESGDYGLSAQLKVSVPEGEDRVAIIMSTWAIGSKEEISVSRTEQDWSPRGHMLVIAPTISWVYLSLDTTLQTISTSAAKYSEFFVFLNRNDYQATLAPWEDVSSALYGAARAGIQGVATGMGRRQTFIDVLPVRSLLFDGAYATRLSEVALPHDFIMFGHLAPDLNAFEITPALQLLSQGAQHNFAITPVQSGVTWSVANLPGESGPSGTIDPSTGAYTAPMAAHIPGRQVRVKVTATKGSATSTALVTILKNTVNVNPRVQYLIANSAGTASCDFAAGALPDMGITWTPPPATAGTLTNSSNPNRDKTFTAAPRDTDKGLEVVRVAVSAGGGTENAYVLVKHADAVLAVTARDIDVSQQTVLLEATLSSNPAPGVHQWSILAGSGSIDERGVLTADADPAEPFVFVQVKIEALPGYNFYGYLLLPLPLAPYPEKSAASLTTAVLGD